MNCGVEWTVLSCFWNCILYSAVNEIHMVLSSCLLNTCLLIITASISRETKTRPMTAKAKPMRDEEEEGDFELCILFSCC